MPLHIYHFFVINVSITSKGRCQRSLRLHYQTDQNSSNFDAMPRPQPRASCPRFPGGSMPKTEWRDPSFSWLFCSRRWLQPCSKNFCWSAAAFRPDTCLWKRKLQNSGQVFFIREKKSPEYLWRRLVQICTYMCINIVAYLQGLCSRGYRLISKRPTAKRIVRTWHSLCSNNVQQLINLVPEVT